jgi:glycine cleavage system transcriptional repressor
MAEDRPGIVATVSRTVVEALGNIESCSQTVLSGYFTLIMVISFTEPIDLEAFAQKLTNASDSEHGLQVMIRPYRQAVAQADLKDAENFVVTCFGPDSQGVIFRFSMLLAEKGINIVDLYGQRQDDRFVLISQVQIPGRWDLAMLQADLEQLGTQLGFAVRLQHENIFIATNQLRLGRMGTLSYSAEKK